MPDVHHDLPPIAQRSDLLRLGVDDKAIGRAKLSGALIPVRRGAYLRRADDRMVDDRDRHGLVTVATMPRLGDGAVVSHVSAAVLHGIAVWPHPTNCVHVTKARPGGGRRTKTLYLHIAALADQDVVAIAGIDVTSAARTVVDVARTEPFTTGVVVADHALAQRLVGAEELSAVLGQHRGRAGSRRAAAVLAFANARSESVGSPEAGSRCFGRDCPLRNCNTRSVIPTGISSAVPTSPTWTTRLPANSTVSRNTQHVVSAGVRSPTSSSPNAAGRSRCSGPVGQSSGGCGRTSRRQRSSRESFGRHSTRRPAWPAHSDGSVDAAVESTANAHALHDALAVGTSCEWWCQGFARGVSLRSRIQSPARGAERAAV